RAIFSCRPRTAAQQATCARAIVSRLASEAFRRDVSEADVVPLMKLYRQGAADGGFETGIPMALEGILASPPFGFRFEETPSPHGGDAYALSGAELASRLSFFLWSAGPDEPLLRAAKSGRLSTPAGLDAEVRRMLGDPRADSLASRFAAQWLRLQDLDKIN